MRSKIARVIFPVFSNYLVHAEITNDLYKAMDRYPETKVIEDRDCEAITVNVVKEPRSFIFLKEGVSPGTIAHESWHVVRRMMNYMDVELDNEVVAYHLGHLVDKICEKAHRRIRRKK